MTRVAYNGTEALTFTDYTDLEKGKTLHAEPGASYDIAPASGRTVPAIPVPWFTAEAPPAGGKPKDAPVAVAKADPKTGDDADIGGEG